MSGYHLSERQVLIIKAVVEEYTETAEPVGSTTLDRKYGLGVSPATIRNEMSYLVDLGYLAQPHTSAGRIPTPKAIKLYINELMKERSLTVAEEVSAKEKVWERRHDLGDALRTVVHELSRRTDSIGIAVTDDHKAYHSGYAKILDYPEFYDIDVTKTVLSLLDQAHRMMDLFYATGPVDDIRILLGDDFASNHLQPVSIVYAHFETPHKKGMIGVIGSCRADYPYVVPLVRHFSNLLDNISA